MEIVVSTVLFTSSRQKGKRRLLVPHFGPLRATLAVSEIKAHTGVVWGSSIKFVDSLSFFRPMLQRYVFKTCVVFLRNSVFCVKSPSSRLTRDWVVHRPGSMPLPRQKTGVLHQKMSPLQFVYGLFTVLELGRRQRIACGQRQSKQRSPLKFHHPTTLGAWWTCNISTEISAEKGKTVCYMPY